MSLTVPETAERYGVTERQIRSLLGRGVLKGSKPGRDWLVNERSAAAYFAKERRPGPRPRRSLG